MLESVFGLRVKLVWARDLPEMNRRVGFAGQRHPVTWLHEFPKLHRLAGVVLNFALLCVRVSFAENLIEGIEVRKLPQIGDETAPVKIDAIIREKSGFVFAG